MRAADDLRSLRLVLTAFSGTTCTAEERRNLRDWQAAIDAGIAGINAISSLRAALTARDAALAEIARVCELHQTYRDPFVLIHTKATEAMR